MERKEIYSLWTPLVLEGPADKQYHIRRHWFLQTCKSAAQRFAARELIIRFWREKKETKDVWLNNAMVRVRVKICRQLNVLLQYYDLGFRFVEELIQTMEDVAETNLIEGIVPYNLCFRHARIKDYLHWFEGYQDKQKGIYLPFTLKESMVSFQVAIFPFKLNPRYEKMIIIPRRIPVPNPKIPLGGNVLYIMEGHRIRSKEPSVFIFSDM